MGVSLRAIISGKPDSVAHMRGVRNGDYFVAAVQSLSPRLDRVYLGFLRGLSEKQIAAELRVSVHTIHEYATELHRRLEMETRGELLSLVIRDFSPANVEECSSVLQVLGLPTDPVITESDVSQDDPRTPDSARPPA